MVSGLWQVVAYLGLLLQGWERTGCPARRSRKDPRPGEQAHMLQPRDVGTPAALNGQRGTRGPLQAACSPPPNCCSSPSSGFARSLSLCVSCLCAFCVLGRRDSEWPGQLGGGEGGVGERWLLTPFSPRDRHLWLSCYLSLHTLAGIPEAAMWVAGCVWLCASTCALSSPSCLWRVLPLFLTDCWMRK